MCKRLRAMVNFLFSLIFHSREDRISEIIQIIKPNRRLTDQSKRLISHNSQNPPNKTKIRMLLSKVFTALTNRVKAEDEIGFRVIRSGLLSEISRSKTLRSREGEKRKEKKRGCGIFNPECRTTNCCVDTRNGREIVSRKRERGDKLCEHNIYVYIYIKQSRSDNTRHSKDIRMTLMK